MPRATAVRTAAFDAIDQSTPGRPAISSWSDSARWSIVDRESPVLRLIVPVSVRIGTLTGNANPASIEADDVAELQLPSASAINLAVHGHIAVDDRLFHVSTGVEEPSELQELPEANDLTADRYVVDRSRVRHPRMLVDQVPAPEPSSSDDRKNPPILIWDRSSEVESESELIALGGCVRAGLSADTAVERRG